jgi:hypothetical protein
MSNNLSQEPGPGALHEPGHASEVDELRSRVAVLEEAVAVLDAVLVARGLLPPKPGEAAPHCPPPGHQAPRRGRLALVAPLRPTGG